MENFYKTMALMNDAQKQIFQALSKEERDELLKKDPEEVVKTIQVSVEKAESDAAEAAGKDPVTKTDNDESFMLGDTQVLKSVVGEAPFLIMKAQQKQIDDAKVREDKLAKSLDAEKELRVEKEAGEEAEKRWPNLPGTPLEKGRTLLSINKLDPTIKDAQLKMLDSGNDSNSKLFKEHGQVNHTLTSDAGDSLDKLAKKRAEETGETFAKAYDHIIQTEEGKDLYDKTLN